MIQYVTVWYIESETFDRLQNHVSLTITIPCDMIDRTRIGWLVYLLAAWWPVVSLHVQPDILVLAAAIPYSLILAIHKYYLHVDGDLLSQAKPVTTLDLIPQANIDDEWANVKHGNIVL